ncbi:hypothetical protein PBI_DEWDROP_19 [Microbacterium phage Dewdrop]|nr:hypothetical protein PBI_LEAF_19 [Microbacterium phage Leaf]QGZ17388.1 hypothetical protein PBI_DEWDROP_19 [Microbacterium phage Dewdrop]
MSKAVWKFPVRIGTMGDDFTLRMPVGAEVLSVEYDWSLMCPAVWAMVDTENAQKTEERGFSVRGTGHDADGLERHRFLGTVPYPHVALVFHFWAHAAPRPERTDRDRAFDGASDGGRLG